MNNVFFSTFTHTFGETQCEICYFEFSSNFENFFGYPVMPHKFFHQSFLVNTQFPLWLPGHLATPLPHLDSLVKPELGLFKMLVIHGQHAQIEVNLLVALILSLQLVESGGGKVWSQHKLDILNICDFSKGFQY